MSRLTFREKAGDVCWQRQLRDHYRDEPPPPVSLDLRAARVRPVSRLTATQVILKYEWLGTMSSTSKHFGIFFGPYCAGVACVAVNGTGTAGPYGHQQFGIEKRQFATLARGACVQWAPTGSNSKLVAWTCRLLVGTGVALLIAYADEDAGEIGTIYQACNWTYIGRSTGTARPDMQLIAPSGRVLDRRLLGNVARDQHTTIDHVRRLLRERGWQEQAANPKHRYVYVIDRADVALRARVAAMAHPYPKRGRGADSGAAGDQPAGDGAHPIRPLHI